MSTAISDLEPKLLWKHFAAISSIPRGSGNEAAARAYVLAQAAALGLEATADPVGNVVVRKLARPGRENAVPAALQGHLDMVCEKNEGTVHDFEKDPIRLVRDGDWLKADGTTLGADNGVGAAALLAVMESGDVNHGPLEFVFTIDEERGLTGAAQFPERSLRAKYLLNLDNEEENTLCIGCAGGMNTIGSRKFALRAPAAKQGWRIKLSGFQGGHSGIDIHKNRGNAVRILGRAILALAETLPVEVASLAGGSKRNAIPREASAIIALDAAREQDLRAQVAAFEAAVRSELGAFDPGVRVTVESAPAPAQVFEKADAALIAGLLIALPHGVLAMNPDIAGLVQTSTNLAVISTADGAVLIETSQRSDVETAKNAAVRGVVTILKMAGFEIQHSGAYPGWKPEPQSDIVRLAQAAHEQILGVKPELLAVHAGLECGVIGEKHPGMQMISFGPHMVDVHSPAERLKISSVEPFWRYLTGLLARL
jgi:dipeptidase D